MKHRLVLVLAAGLVAAFLVTSPGAAGPGFNNKYSPEPQIVECLDDQGNKVGQIVYDGPLHLWPPNHKYQDVTITATAVDADDDVTLNTAGTHDEYAEDGTEHNGAGNTADDVSPASAADGPNDGSAATGHSLRSERSGRGDGRLYTLDWQATFVDDGDQGYGTASCGSRDFDTSDTVEPTHADAFEVDVPHDMRGGAGWR